MAEAGSCELRVTYGTMLGPEMGVSMRVLKEIGNKLGHERHSPFQTERAKRARVKNILTWREVGFLRLRKVEDVGLSKSRRDYVKFPTGQVDL